MAGLYVYTVCNEYCPVVLGEQLVCPTYWALNLTHCHQLSHTLPVLIYTVLFVTEITEFSTVSMVREEVTEDINFLAIGL